MRRSSSSSMTMLLLIAVLVALGAVAFSQLQHPSQQTVVAASAGVAAPPEVVTQAVEYTTDMVRLMIANSTCMSLQTFYSPTNGQLIVLCQLEYGHDGGLWGGKVMKVTAIETFVLTFLGGRSYECTLFIARWPYWQERLLSGGFIEPTSVLGEGHPLLDYLTKIARTL